MLILPEVPVTYLSARRNRPSRCDDMAAYVRATYGFGTPAMPFTTTGTSPSAWTSMTPSRSMSGCDSAASLFRRLEAGSSSSDIAVLDELLRLRFIVMFEVAVEIEVKSRQVT